MHFGLPMWGWEDELFSHLCSIYVISVNNIHKALIKFGPRFFLKLSCTHLKRSFSIVMYAPVKNCCESLSDCGNMLLSFFLYWNWKPYYSLIVSNSHLVTRPLRYGRRKIPRLYPSSLYADNRGQFHAVKLGRSFMILYSSCLLWYTMMSLSQFFSLRSPKINAATSNTTSKLYCLPSVCLPLRRRRQILSKGLT